MAGAKWFRREVSVRFRDTDSAGHVHHGVYLSYLEEARIDFLQRLLGKYGISDIDFVIAMLTINYNSRASHRDRLEVAVRPKRVGSTSWTMEFSIADRATGATVCDGESVQVAYDYKKRGKKPLPPALRRKLLEWGCG